MPVSDRDGILLGHGSGGQMSTELIEQVFLPAFRNPWLERLDDQAVMTLGSARVAFTTDAFVVTPIFFPGGDIGALAVNGTVNDLVMCGARALHLSASFILEEGFPMEDLRRIVDSMSRACAASGVSLVTGDTKVVPHGSADRIFIVTSGIGLVDDAAVIAADHARAGDRLIVSGTMGDHGMAIMAKRAELELDSEIRSDTTALGSLVDAMRGTGARVHCLRDPTRGGLATSLNELARRSHVGMIVDEGLVPVRPEVRGLCELLGLDPLYVANEGKLVAVVDRADAGRLLETMHRHPDGRDAQIIGEVVDDHPGQVMLRTGIGGTRRLDLLVGEQLPRIC